MKRTRLLVAMAFATLLLASGVLAAGVATASPDHDVPEEPDATNHTASIDPELVETPSASPPSQQHANGDDSVHVMVEASTDGNDAARTVRDYGSIHVVRENRLEATVHRNNLTSLANESDIAYIHTPRYLERHEKSEGVERTGADELHLRNVDGDGSTVAIVDLSFDPDHEPIADAVVETKNFKQDEPIDGRDTRHGDASAEIVHEMAPEADLVLVSVLTTLELKEAIEWINDYDDIDAASASIGNPTIRLDGNAKSDQLIDAGVETGTNWVVSAGNYGEGTHYFGEFNERSDDEWHHYDPDDETEICNIFSPSRPLTTLTLQWDAWETTGERYGLHLYRIEDDGNLDFVAGSDRDQTHGADPVEQIEEQLDTSEQYCIAIHNSDASGDAMFNLFTSDNVDLLYESSARSIIPPATGERVLTVGASGWDLDGVRGFSSRGPTVDGRSGVDLIAPDGVTTTAYDFPYTGTSAAAPHVAGTAAVIAAQNQSATALDINDRLRATGGDVGSTQNESEIIGAGHLEANTAAAPFAPTATSPPNLIGSDESATVEVEFEFEPIAGTAEVRLRNASADITARGTESVDIDTQSTNVTVDADELPDGDVSVEARVTHQGWQNVEGLTATSQTQKVTSGFSIETFEVPGSIEHGDELDAAVTIKNVGETDQTETIELRIGDDPTTDESSVVSSKSVTLDAGQQETVTLGGEINESVDTGQQKVAAVGERETSIDEIHILEPAAIENYANEDDIVDTDGLRDAVDDWRGGDIETDLLRDVVDAWRSGESVD